MDEELLIKIPAELDEDSSVERIAVQLPSIEKKIAASRTIKLSCELDTNVTEQRVESSIQQLAKSVSKNSIKRGKLKVPVDVDFGSIDAMVESLESLKLPKDGIKQFVDSIEKANITVTNIRASFDSVKQVVSATISGVNDVGDAITKVQRMQFGTDKDTGNSTFKMLQDTVTIEQQFEEVAQSSEAAVTKVSKADEKRISFLREQLRTIEEINANYTDANASKPLKDAKYLNPFKDKYDKVKAEIDDLLKKEGVLSNESKEHIRDIVSELRLLGKQQQNAQYVATSLRTRTSGDVYKEYTSKLKAYESQLKGSGKLTDEFQRKIDALGVTLEEAFEIDNRANLSSSLTSFLNDFDGLKSEVGVFDNQIDNINNAFKEMAQGERRIVAIRKEMLKPSTSSNSYNELKSQLALELSHQKEISAEVGKQIAANPALIKYAKEYNNLIYTRRNCEIELARAEGNTTRELQSITASMRTMPAVIGNIQARFDTLTNAPVELEQRIKSLNALMDAVNNSKNDSDKIAAYNQLEDALRGCNAEITQLLGLDRADFKGFKFSNDLEKAKSDLETIRRTWSAFSKDRGLNDQFHELERSLARVNNDMDLRKWRSQFSLFKAEVKAAGKNVMSLGDTLKNNLAKVGEWLSATSLVFRAMRLLKTGVNTIVDLNTAMVDLKKVTNETDSEYRKFYLDANETAKNLGVTTEEVISQTAEWARLGYNIKEASQLAKNSAIFEAISPGMDISKATDGLVSIIKAYDLDVENSLDGIISKVNEVGNKFAVSNEDIVEAMTRSSSAMAAANNTFEETVALATAAIEITRDADTVGNGLKTLSMRIRGYDEETEEYSDDVATLTGTIADLTKVASNNNRGISLFEPGDPETYRSTYDILSDIADIWGEMTDKNRASLLEALFGKRQAQIGSAILSNFDQARSAIEKMENSAGSADREMDKIKESLEYKLNSLKETWVGVAQNLLNQNTIGGIIDGLQAISGAVDFLTNKLGLFGTAGITLLGVQLGNAIKTTNKNFEEARSTISGLKWDSDSITEYANALSGLTVAQQDMLLAEAKRKDVNVDTNKVIDSINQLRIAEAARTSGLEESAIVEALNLKSGERLTKEKINQYLTTLDLNQEERERIALALLGESANKKLSFSFKTLATNAKAALIAMATNPMTWVTVAITAISFLINRSEEEKRKAEELRQKQIEVANAAKEEAESIRDLYQAYLDANKAYESGKGSKDDLRTATDSLLESLGYEKGAVKDLIEEYGDLDTAIKEATKSKLRDQAVDMLVGYEAAKTEAVEAAKKNAGESVFLRTSDSKRNVEDVNQKVLDRLIGAGYAEESYSTYNGVWDYSIFSGINGKGGYGKLNEAYEQLVQMRDLLVGGIGIDYSAEELAADAAFKFINDHINSVSEELEAAKTQALGYNKVVASFAYNDYVAENGVPKTRKEFEALRQAILGDVEAVSDLNEAAEKSPDGALSTNIYAGSYEEIESAIDSVLGGMKELEAFTSSPEPKSNRPQVYKAQLKELKDVVSETQKSYDALETAQQEMDLGKGLSPKTIEALANAEEDYLDYLYEENGVVKLNTKAWKENADAKLKADIQSIQKEIESRQKQNKFLESENNGIREMLTRVGNNPELRDQIDANTDKLRANEEQIDANNAAIEENQALLRLYGSIFDDIQPKVNAFVSLMNALGDVETNIGKVSSVLGSFAEDGSVSISTLNGLSDVFGDLSSYESFVGVLLDTSSTMEDVQEACNRLAGEYLYSSGVLNSVNEDNAAFIEQTLESIGVTNAHVIVTERLEAARLNEGLAAEGLSNVEWDLTKRLLEQRGASETVIAALELLRKERYNAALAATNFVEADEGIISSLMAQAKAAGVATTSLVALAKAQSLKDRYDAGELTNRFWTNADARTGKTRYEAYLDKYKEDAFADLSVDLAFPEIVVKTPDGSGGKSGSKDIEEYIVDIDRYREALERLRKVQESRSNIETDIENSDLRGQIALQEQLIETYRDEQDALQNLKNLRAEGIREGVEKLRGQGFDVEYDADKNNFWVSNLEHINELTAQTKGKYESLQEATNALRKETEELVGSLTDLNESNRESDQERVTIDRTVHDEIIKGYETRTQLAANEISFRESQLNNATFEQNTANVEHYTAEIVTLYRQMQENIHKEAEYYRSQGYAEDSDEVTALKTLWWEYADNIKDAKNNVIDYLTSIVDASNSAVDDIQNVYDTLHRAADEFAESGGYLTVDTYQDILALGPQYMQMLADENGALMINEERIKGVIAARVEQMALENAMTYVERLRLAATGESLESLDELLFATQDVTDATWGLVYAKLALMKENGQLDTTQYEAALHNIKALQNMAVGTIDGIKNSVEGAGDLLDYVMEMVKSNVEQEIEAIERMKDRFVELIDLRKESLDAAKDEADYQKDVASRLKEMAKLQARIDALGLDDSREAQAERAKLLEEMDGLQSDLADKQSDYAIEQQKEALDKMQEDYDKTQDKRIESLEESISSEQKLYDMATAYIRNNWKTLLDDLRTWNYEFGSDLTTEIEGAWDKAVEAARNYFNFVSSNQVTGNNYVDYIESTSGGGSSSSSNSDNSGPNYQVATTGKYAGYDVHDLVALMRTYSAQWHNASDSGRRWLENENASIASMVSGIIHQPLKLGDDGKWYLPNGEELYKKYHSGGIVGGGRPKDDEQLALLRNKEWVLNEDMVDNLRLQMERIDKLSQAFKDIPVFTRDSIIPEFVKARGDTVNNVTNSRPVEINIGDTIIQGDADAATVEEHARISRGLVNQIAKLVGV